MSYILAMETATKICSVALVKDGELLAKIEEGGEYSHAEKLGPFIEELLRKTNVSYSQLSAVAVSKGPGSYTGLRIGTSTAKGLCYALDIPLISISTLRSMAYMIQKEGDVNCGLFCPMIDARRMEVYAAVYDAKLNILKDSYAEILDSSSFDSYLKDNKICFFGDGSEKSKEILEQHENAIFSDKGLPSAEGIAYLANKKFNSGDFENLAYFEPFYLKDFVAGKAKKLL